MRDYYSEYLGKKSPNTPRTEVSKGAKGVLEAYEVPFAPFDPSVSYGIPEISESGRSQTESDKGPSAPFDPSLTYTIPEIFGPQCAHLNAEARGQLLFEIEERIAIMMFDGGLSETDANAAAVADVLRGWFGLLG